MTTDGEVQGVSCRSCFQEVQCLASQAVVYIRFLVLWEGSVRLPSESNSMEVRTVWPEACWTLCDSLGLSIETCG